MTKKEFQIGELATQAGVTVRTVRYYLDQGLLQPADSRGRYALFSAAHLERLDLIRRLKELHLPLDEIKNLLETAEDKQIQSLLSRVPGLEKKPAEHKPSIQASIIPAAPEMVSRRQHFSQADPSEMPGKAALDYLSNITNSHRRINEMKPDPTSFKSMPRRSFSSEADLSEHSKPWLRLEFAPGVELHYREQLEPPTSDLLKQLIEFALKLFKKA
jgi:DNA-binding transcriptional MerR regulator